MLITTHYPQVPLATSNVATDLARVDNQQKPPIIPPQKPAKGHEERSFNPQNERAVGATAYAVAEKKQQQNQSSHQQHTLTQQSADPKTLASQSIRPQSIRINPSNVPALQRKDIQIKTQSSELKSQPQTRQRESSQTTSQSPAVYQKFGQRIGQFYQQQSAPNIESQLQTIV